MELAEDTKPLQDADPDNKIKAETLILRGRAAE